MKRRWFGPKQVGWGAAPRSWEGWIVVAGMLAALAAYAKFGGPAVAETIGVSRPLAMLGDRSSGFLCCF